jgi:hypothetical protein
MWKLGQQGIDGATGTAVTIRLRVGSAAFFVLETCRGHRATNCTYVTHHP